jgi:hypothetical protein
MREVEGRPMNEKRFWGSSFLGNRLMIANDLLPLARGESVAADKGKEESI